MAVRISRFLLVALLVVPGAASAVELTECEQIVTGNVTLTGDLDCSGNPSFPAVVLKNGATLDLAGFTLTADRGVHCEDTRLTCTVMSSVPGGRLLGTLPEMTQPIVSRGIFSRGGGIRVVGVAVTNFAGHGIDANARVSIENSAITGNGGRGIWFADAVRIVNSTIADNGGDGISNVDKLRIDGSVITGNGGWGIVSPGALKLRNSTVSGNANDGISTGQKARLRDCSIDDNGGHGMRVGNQRSISIKSCSVDGNGMHGITGARKLKARGSSFSGNGGVGIESSSGNRCQVTVVECEVEGNGRFGVHAGPDETACTDARVRARGSSLTGNATDGDCFVTESCADVASDTPPRIDAATTCDHSYVIGSGFPGASWSVCSLD